MVACWWAFLLGNAWTPLTYAIPAIIILCKGESQKGGCMRGLISMFLSLLFSVGMLNPVLAADRVVVCEEFYQET